VAGQVQFYKLGTIAVLIWINAARRPEIASFSRGLLKRHGGGCGRLIWINTPLLIDSNNGDEFAGYLHQGGSMTARAKPGSRSHGAATVARRLAQIEDDGAAFDADAFIEDRCQMVAEAANARAHRRGSEEGFDLDDWLTAEDEIDQGSGYARHARAHRPLN
jgi:hypothetical protein